MISVPSQPLPAVRTVFLSDIHLGTRECQAERLLAFLESVQADCIYLEIGRAHV